MDARAGRLTMDTPGEDVSELRRQLETMRLEAAREKARASSYAAQIDELKRQNLSAHSRVEQEEELLTNNLMKKLEKVNSEKREMLMRVEQEEEFLTNSLQKRLDRVMREKLELEAQMAREHEQLDKASGDLERRLEALSSERERLSAEKVELERQLEAEQEFIVNKLQKQTTNLAREKEQLRAEREDLRRQVEKLLSDKIRLNKEKVELENVMEAEEESIVNRLQMQMLELFQRNKYLERRLEAGSQTPSVVSESETSEDEGGSHHASRRQFGHGTSPQHRSWKHPHAAMGIPHGVGGMAPWESGMYMSVQRRRSGGSASASGSEPGSLHSTGGGGRGAGRVGGASQGGLSQGGLSSGHGASGGHVPQVSTARDHGGAGESADATPRSSIGNTPLTTPRSERRG